MIFLLRYLHFSLLRCLSGKSIITAGYDEKNIDL